MESFDSTKRNLYEILKDVNSGKIQLPDFQRGWVWDDDRIKGIIASVAKSFPIGAVMLLETGNENIRFKTKPVEGVVGLNGTKPEMLILDGQQRITSLYQAIITNRVVNTRNSKGYEIKRWYYIDMVKALDTDSDLEEAIFSINENKIITENIGRDIILDLSTEENEFKNLMYPVSMVDNYDEWRTKFIEYWDYDRDKIKFWNEFEKKIIKGFNGYNLPVIVMKKENTKEAVCQVFEKVNTGGVSLTVFELLTASFASDEFDLKANWEDIKNKFKPYKILNNTSNTDIIQAITLYSTFNKRLAAITSGLTENIPSVSAKRKEMLNLTLSEYRKYRDEIVEGFIKSSKILVENHIFNSRDLPYSTQLVPMAAILAKLGDKIDNVGNKNKLMRWFWCGVFGELYGSANETRYALDMIQVTDWIENNAEEPKTIYDANFSPSRLNTLRTRNSAAYKGVYALMMDENTKDWLSATKIDFSTYFSESIDIHHIFPVAWCEKNNIPRNDFDCIINKTPLSGRTNRIVSGDAPSKYLERLKKYAGVSDSEFNDILRSHVVSPDYMYKDDFYGFFNNRKEQILQRIEKAIGKQIPRDQLIEEEGKFVDNSIEDDEL
ncbi:MAG: hypothetical protein BWX59_02121 [Bacteroidetes bacterium ADurb.Bin028]|nr:MAG: hypothetical protein BWX59_02121 [Bacteroidetes bacterium ADurb.Bin028]